jgi:SAM-dependent methyltransferase
VSTHYANPEVWASGRDHVYEALSQAVLAEHAAELDGRGVLDLGAGTGATSRAVAKVGGRPLSIDSSWPMLQHDRLSRHPAIVGDACALPMGDDTVGATVAAFVLSHVLDPVALLREAGRVTVPGGIVVVVSFAVDRERTTAKATIEELLRDRGWTPPLWFRRLKEELEPVVTDPQALTSMALAAGLRAPVVATFVVDTGIGAPHELVDWRLGSPGVASFLAAMTDGERARLHTEAVEAIEALDPAPQPLMLELRVLSSRAAATRRSVSA